MIEPGCRKFAIGVISNPHSGGNKKGLGRIRADLAASPDILHCEASSPAEVVAILNDFSHRGINLVVVNGGDGTVQAVLTALLTKAIFPCPPLLALLQAGTTSMLARDVGIGGKPVGALGKVRDWAAAPDRSEDLILERSILKIRQHGAAEVLCGMFFGAGAIPRGIEIFHKAVNPRGMRGELLPGLVLFRLLLAIFTRNEKVLPPTPMSIDHHTAEEQNGRYLFAMVSTLERLFLGLRPFWGTEDGPLHFTAIKAAPPCLLRNLSSLLVGRCTATTTPKNGYYSHNSRMITLDFRGRFTLDGELFDASAPLTIEPAGPVRFLRI